MGRYITSAIIALSLVLGACQKESLKQSPTTTSQYTPIVVNREFLLLRTCNGEWAIKKDGEILVGSEGKYYPVDPTVTLDEFCKETAK